METILKYLSNSKSVLSYANQEKLFPYKICDPQVLFNYQYSVYLNIFQIKFLFTFFLKMFSSNLPEDLVIQFHVEGSYIVSSLYALQFHKSLPHTKHGILGASKQPPPKV